MQRCELVISRVQKVFGATAALSDANMTVLGGEIHGLVGENGAGKSTLIKILAGVHGADGGSIALDGVSISNHHSTANAHKLGFAFIHQDPTLVPEFTVAENLALVLGYPRRAGVIDWPGVRRQASTILSNLGIDLDPDAQVRTLPLSRRAMLAIAAAVASNARILVLDEPTASLSADDVSRLFEVLARLRDSQLAIILVTHRLDEVLEQCDRITVLRDGATVSERSTSGLSRRELVASIIGEDRPDRGRDVAARGAVALRADRISVDYAGPVSIDVHHGEILALTGAMDAGHHAVGEALAGVRRLDAGGMKLDDAVYEPKTCREALHGGVSFMPSDRSLGLAGGMSVRENLNANPMPGVRWLSPSREKRSTLDALKTYQVRPPDPDRQISTLSGGNAQKVMLARTLLHGPRVAILVEPTTGVDVGSREEVYDLLRRAAKSGIAVVVVSSDFEEVATVADRALVMHRGRIVEEFAGNNLHASDLVASAIR